MEYSVKYDPDWELEGSGNVDYGHNLADAIMNKREANSLEKRAQTSDAEDFIRMAEMYGLNPDDVFENPQEKAKLLKGKGYKTLKFQGQKFKKGEPGVPISKANPAKIGNAFKSTYYSSLRKISSENQ